MNHKTHTLELRSKYNAEEPYEQIESIVGNSVTLFRIITSCQTS